jgi:NAD-dependent histone deacetylase SIR2
LVTQDNRELLEKRRHTPGRLRPRLVLYDEESPDQEAIWSVAKADIKARPEVLIVVGTSIRVKGVQNLVGDLYKATKMRRNGVTAWINSSDDPPRIPKVEWDIVVQSTADEIAQLVDLPRWQADGKDRNRSKRVTRQRSIDEDGPLDTLSVTHVEPKSSNVYLLYPVYRMPY